METRSTLGSPSALLLGIVLSLMAVGPVFAESRVVFQASKDDVKKACDDVKGVPVEGETGAGYGCYNPKNGVLVACSDGGTCTGYLPKGAPRGKSLGNILKFGTGSSAAPPTSLTEGSSSGGGGGTTGGNGGGGNGGCGPDGCLY
jgi:hypothetical protein